MFRNFIDLPRAVPLLCLGTLINRAGTIVLPLLSLYLHERLGLSEQFATLTVGAFGCGSIVAGLVGGHLADRIGRRTVMLAALLGGAALLLLFGQMRAPAAIVVTAFCFAAIADMYRPAASAMMADLVPPERRGHAFGLMYVAINLGFSIGASVAGTLFVLVPAAWLFAADAATSAIYALIIALWIAETLPRRRDVQAANDGQDALAAPPPPPSAAEAFRHILGNGAFLLFCAGSLFCGLVYMQATTTLALHMGRLGFGANQYGPVIALNGLLICLCQIPVTAAVTRMRRGIAVAAGTTAVAVGFGLTGVASTVPMFAATVVIWTFGEMMQSPLMQAIVADFAPQSMRGRYMGVFGMTYAGANALGAPIGGFVLSRWGGRALWPACFAVCMISAAIFFSLRRRIAVRA